MARGLKFRILVKEVLYYPGSENKGADQLRGYREADLRLNFRICKKPVFSRRGSFYLGSKKQVCSTDQFVSLIPGEGSLFIRSKHTYEDSGS